MLRNKSIHPSNGMIDKVKYIQLVLEAYMYEFVDY